MSRSGRDVKHHGPRSGGASRRRRECLYPRRTTVLILCEGDQTEPNYMHGLKRLVYASRLFSVTVRSGRGGSAEAVVAEGAKAKESAKRRGEAYDEVWCLIDVESARERAAFERACSRAANSDISLCASNPCFEVWLLSHFERTGRSFIHCDEVREQLSRWWRREFGVDYQKNDTQIHERVRGRIDDAVKNARWVRETHHRIEHCIADCNSATDVYRLVDHLVHPGSGETSTG